MKKIREIFDLPPTKILKIAGVAFLIILLISVGLRLIGSTVGQFGQSSRTYPETVWYGEDEAFGELHEAVFATREAGLNLSVRNLSDGGVIPPHIPVGTTGNDAEAFEVTNYNASIESRNSDVTCSQVADLKVLEHVIFETSNEEERGCNYTFKVEHERVPEILAVIEGLDPRDLSENTYTIKRTLDDFTSETEILEKKLETIVETLTDAVRAYDGITAIATRNQDAESLAKIIDSKLAVIERLTRERITITTQLDHLSRAKAEQIDRLEYSYFYVNVYENKFVDGTYISDSWKRTVKEALRDINRSIQDATVNLVVFLFEIVEFAVYVLLLLYIAKYGWKLLKHIWRK